MLSLIVKVPYSFRVLRPLVLVRKYSNDSAFKEIRIPVPWGHIAGKQWGQDNGRPLLGLHGWQDNCGTFDLLAPHLPSDVRFVAIDLPGHGLSSHIPAGFFYDMVSYLGYVRWVTRHLGWDDFSILGHSLGAMVGLGYAGCYPSHVRKTVVLDILQPLMMPPSVLASFVAKRIDQMVDASSVPDNGRTKRTYTMDELTAKLLESTGDFLTEASARILLKRGTRPVPVPKGKGGEDRTSSRLELTRDPKLRISLPVATEEQLNVMRESVRCDILVVLANNGIRKKYPGAMLEGVLDTYRKNARSVRLEMVEGTHHVHMNNPETVAPLLKEFFFS